MRTATMGAWRGRTNPIGSGLSRRFRCKTCIQPRRQWLDRAPDSGAPRLREHRSSRRRRTRPSDALPRERAALRALFAAVSRVARSLRGAAVAHRWLAAWRRGRADVPAAAAPAAGRRALGVLCGARWAHAGVVRGRAQERGLAEDTRLKADLGGSTGAAAAREAPVCIGACVPATRCGVRAIRGVSRGLRSRGTARDCDREEEHPGKASHTFAVSASVPRERRFIPAVSARSHPRLRRGTPRAAPRRYRRSRTDSGYSSAPVRSGSRTPPSLAGSPAPPGRTGPVPTR